MEAPDFYKFSFPLMTMAAMGIVTSVPAATEQPVPRFHIVDPGFKITTRLEIGINDRGQVIGSMPTGKKNRYEAPIAHAIIWQNGKRRDLGALPDYGSFPAGINDKGQVVGVLSYTTSGAVTASYERAFLWERGRMRDLGVLPGHQYSRASAINNKGELVGASWPDLFPTPDNVVARRGFLYRGGKMIDLGTLGGVQSDASDINDKGQVVGSSDTDNMSPHGEPTTTHAFLWDKGRMRDLGKLPDSRKSEAKAINEAGQVVGTAEFWPPTGSPVTYRAFLWEKGKMRNLGVLPRTNRSMAADINDRGQVVGSASSDAVGTHAFLWQDGKMYDLNSLIRPKSGWILQMAEAINSRGQIVGFGTYKGEQRYFLLTPK